MNKKVRLIFADFEKEYIINDSPFILDFLQKNNIFIDALCSGEGKCKKCLVNLDGEFVLACQTKINKDSTIILQQKNLYKTKEEIFFNEVKNKYKEFPLIKKIYIDFSLQIKQPYISDFDFLNLILQKENLIISELNNISLLNKLNNYIHSQSKVIIYLLKTNEKYELINITEKIENKNIGLAIDLGTTTISISAVDFDNVNILDTINFYNPQIIYGADIIHRIIFSLKKENREKIQQSLINGLSQAIKFLLNKNKINSDEITAIVISGNTTMIHLFLGLNAKYIREFPYSPVSNNFSKIQAKQFFDFLNYANIFIIPSVANYLGGDLVSGAAYCNLINTHENSLLIDLGTNGEIILASNGILAGCACSAGPAFEGLGLNCGERYSEGVVFDVNYNNEKFHYFIAGETKPKGICGTGVISLLRHLYEKKYIDKRGKFTDKITDKLNNKKIFILFDEKSTAHNKIIYIDEIDIDNILRAKAAIFAGMKLLLKKFELDFYDINKFYISGGIGNSLNIENSIYIGLLPKLSIDKFLFVGNTSLTGAIYYLLYDEIRKQINEVAKKITYFDLSNETEYTDEFLAALFIPHTNEK